MDPAQILEFGLALDHAPLAPGEKLTAHLVAEVRAADDAAPLEEQRPALSVVFVLDCSGSMQGPPLEQVIASVEQLVPLLAARDRVGVVAFADQAAEVSPLEALSDAARARVVSRVRRLRAEGCTNIEDGLRTAFAQLGAAPADGARQVLLLLSDGQPNRGASAPAELAGVVAELRPQVSVSTLGYGPHYQEEVLLAIQQAGGGRYHFVQDPAVCRHEFGRALSVQTDVVADGIRLVLRPSPGVRIVRLCGREQPQFDARGLLVPLPDMLASTTQLLVAELELEPGRERGPWRPLEATLEHHKPGDPALLQRRATLELTVAPGPPQLVPEVFAKVLLVQCEQVRTEARAMADRGQFDGAAAHLRGFVARIDAAPPGVAPSGSPLAEAREQLIDEACVLEMKPAAEGYHSWRHSAASVDFTSSVSYCAAARPARSVLSRGIDAAVAGAVPDAHLEVLAGPEPGRRIPLGALQVLGRTSGADIPLPSPAVSRRQAEILLQGGAFYVRDLGSTGGTMVNGQRVETHRLQPGDELRLGDVVLRFVQE